MLARVSEETLDNVLRLVVSLTEDEFAETIDDVGPNPYKGF